MSSRTLKSLRRHPTIKATAAALTVGALLTGSIQIGAATASAAPLRLPAVGNVQLQVPAGPFLPGIDLPTPPGTPTIAPMPWTPPSADAWTAAPRLLAPAPAPEPQAAPIPAPMPVPVIVPVPPAVVQPVAGFLTSSYGPRWGTHHNGIDVGADLGVPIFAAAGGVVLNAGPASGFGQWVRVLHDDGHITVYGHVDSFTTSVGDRVATGQQIATVGNRGQSTGPHLHLEVWDPAGIQVDPLIWLRDSNVPVTW
ncbi:M23 family metallopeptidase [Prescottella defluvii]|uniref:M23 family metallopeptidase n=1 Tax=Prescottella defluvii TaxID=1323361 RepID=UPI0009DFB8F0|nr:M23 family metallopeptidase [Prescottella defluvii]